jgi:hypothetical protein
MWRLFFKRFGAKIVVTSDFDGEMRWRFAFRDPRGGYMSKSILGWVHLNDDGTCHHSYVTKWCVPFSSNTKAQT